MLDINEPFFKVEGSFYTYIDGTIKGFAYTNGISWQIVTEDGIDMYRPTIFLDRSKCIRAPHNLYQKKRAIERINILIENYQNMYNEYNNENIEDIFSMQLYMIESNLVEYKSLKYTYFSGNAMRFILFDD